MENKGKLLNIIIKENIEFEVIDGIEVVKGLKPEDFIVKEGKTIIPNSIKDLGNNTFELILKPSK